MLQYPVTILMVTLLLALQTGCASSDPDAENRKDRPLTNKEVAAYNATVANEDDKIVCKREKETSSKIARRVCKTVTQVKAEEAAADRLMDSMKSKPAGVPPQS